MSEPFVQHYLQVLKDEKTYRSQLFNITAREYEEVLAKSGKIKSAREDYRRKSPK